MLKNRLIPNIILDNGNVVQSINFKHTNVIGNAITAVDFFNSWVVDEIIVLDVSKTEENRDMFHKIIRGLSKRCFVPLTVGGWIKNIDDISKLLIEGADKIAINTEAVNDPNIIKKSSEIFGSQCIVVSIDVKKNQNNEYEVYTDRGRNPTGMDPIDWSKQVETLGAGEILLTSIDNDGSLKGYDIDLLKKVSNNVSIPVIAFGGVGKWQHFVDGINLGNVNAVSAANIFHFTEHSTYRAKEFMKKSGLNVRLPSFYKIPSLRKPKYNEIF